LFNCLQLVEPAHGSRGSSRADLSQEVGAEAQTTRGGSEATLSQEAGAGATGTHSDSGATLSWEPEPRGHTTALELPETERREPEY
jgi:hypothetical protein